MSNRNQTRSRIAKASWELFRRKGYQETTITDIIEAAGTSRGTFYHYFNGKDELLSTLSYMFDDFYREQLPLLDPETDSCDKLIALAPEQLPGSFGDAAAGLIAVAHKKFSFIFGFCY